MNKAGLKLNVGGFIGGLVKWFIIAVFLMASLSFFQLTAVTMFIQNDIIGYLPHVIAAALILIIAIVIADFMGKVGASSSRAGGLRYAGFLGTLTRYAIYVFAFIWALSQLQIGDYYMSVVFTGLIAMLALAGGLAFGLGGRDVAARTLEKLSQHVKPM